VIEVSWASAPTLRRTDLLNSPVSNSVFRFAIVSSQRIHWFLKRNCSATPSQLVWLYVSLCSASLGIGAVFWVGSAPPVLPFAGLELAAVGFAFVLYARQATDGEKIALQGGRYVRPELRAALTRKIRLALRRAWEDKPAQAGGRWATKG
jgi:hypothetical protein